MNKFILGMVVATAIILLYIFRKKIFVMAQDKPTDKTTGNGLIYSQDKSTLQTVPNTEGAAIGKMITDYLMKTYKSDTLGTQDDSMLDNRKFELNSGDPIGGGTNVKNLNIGQDVINRSILIDRGQCSCGCDCGGCCGCPDQYDIV